MEEKTDRIMQAVAGVLSEKGYQGATITEIAAKAGVSRGLLHYYFKNKEEMLSRVIRHTMDGIFQNMQECFSGASDADELADGLTSSMRAILEGDPQFFRLFLESWTLSRQGPVAEELLKDIHTRFREAVSTGLLEMADRMAPGPDYRFDGLAAILTALVDGLGMQMAIDVGLSGDEKVWKSCREAIRGLVASHIPFGGKTWQPV